MTAKLDLNHIIHWFNAVRNNASLESFWDTQLKSKNWLVTNLKKTDLPLKPLHIVIHGGWNGVLASMIFQLIDQPINKIISVDIDPATKTAAELVNQIEVNNNTFEAAVCNMQDFSYVETPDVVINTSCEHITNETLHTWLNNIPSSAIIVCQSNNNFDVDDHISCSNDLDSFVDRCNLSTVLFKGNYPCKGYTRFMIIGKK